MEDNYIYLNNQDRMFLSTALNDVVKITVIPKSNIAESIFVSVCDKSKIKELDHISERIDNTIKSIFVNTVANTNSYHAFYAPELYYANIMSIIDKNKNEIKFVFVDSTIEIIIDNTEKKTQIYFIIN